MTLVVKVAKVRGSLSVLATVDAFAWKVAPRCATLLLVTFTARFRSWSTFWIMIQVFVPYNQAGTFSCRFAQDGVREGRGVSLRDNRFGTYGKGEQCRLLYHPDRCCCRPTQCTRLAVELCTRTNTATVTFARCSRNGRPVETFGENLGSQRVPVRTLDLLNAETALLTMETEWHCPFPGGILTLCGSGTPEEVPFEGRSHQFLPSKAECGGDWPARHNRRGIESKNAYGGHTSPSARRVPTNPGKHLAS